MVSRLSGNARQLDMITGLRTYISKANERIA